jgi:excisionase family DNA binding protein
MSVNNVRHLGHGESETVSSPLPLTRADVLTVADVAELLRMPRSTVYDLARRGLLPGHRLGRSLRFIRAEIDAWLRAS